MSQLEKIAPRGTYTQIVEQLEARILSGEFPETTLLPSEETLAEQLGVGRRAVREALRALEIKGLVEIRHGVGTLVRRNDLSRFLTALQQNVSAYLHLHRADADQVRQLRALFESAALERLAAQRDPARLAALAENLLAQQQAAATHDAAGYEEYHLRFHRQIVSALDNPLIDMLYGQVLELMHMAMESSAARPGTMPQVITEHQALLAALQTGDGAQAQQLLHTHLQGFTRAMAEVMEPNEGRGQ
jgi:GntR family transcriptional repressor for pyruvate dehydrogenase complex